MLKLQYVGRGMHLEFHHPEYASPILFFAITSPTMPQWDLYDYGNTILGQRLNMIEGVAQVYTFGSPYAVRVRVDWYRVGFGRVARNVHNVHADCRSDRGGSVLLRGRVVAFGHGLRAAIRLLGLADLDVADHGAGGRHRSPAVA